MNKEALNGILAVLSIVVLLIPIGVAGYVQEATVTNVIEVQGTYPTGDHIGLYTGNVSEAFEGHNSFGYDDPLGWEANNDTVFLGYKSSGVYSSRDSVYYGNYVTYTGSGIHSMSVNWSHMPQATYDSVRYLLVPLNVTCEAVADYDFIRIHTDIDKSEGVLVRMYYETSATFMNEASINVIDTDTDLWVIDYADKTQLNNYPNGTVWLGFSAIDDRFNETQTSFTWEVEANSLDPSDYVFGSEYTDITIWVAIVLFMDMAYLLTVVFANPVIDLKYDKYWKRKR